LNLNLVGKGEEEEGEGGPDCLPGQVWRGGGKRGRRGSSFPFLGRGKKQKKHHLPAEKKKEKVDLSLSRGEKKKGETEFFHDDNAPKGKRKRSGLVAVGDRKKKPMDWYPYLKKGTVRKRREKGRIATAEVALGESTGKRESQNHPPCLPERRKKKKGPPRI